MYNITIDDYTFSENERADTWAVRLKTQYKDVLYEYGKISVKETENEEGVLSYQYNIIDSGEHSEDELIQSEEFNNYIGAILEHIITDAFDSGKFKIGENATDNTNNNTKESIH